MIDCVDMLTKARMKRALISDYLAQDRENCCTQGMFLIVEEVVQELYDVERVIKERS